MLKLFPVALAALILAGCSANHVRLDTDYNQSTYDHRNFTLYHSDRDTRVVIHGNPFAMDSAAFAKAVTDTMQGAHFGRPTNFTTAPGPSAERNLKVVMAFNARVGIYELCRRTNISTKPQGASLTLTAAWCFDGRQDSLVTAEVGPATGVGDPRFRDLVRQTVLNLFPQFMDREFIRDDDDRERVD